MVADSDLKSVTDAEKSATLRVRAQRPLVEAVAMAEEAMVVLVAVLAAEERLGKLGIFFIELETLIPLVQLFLWWCRTLVP